MKTDKPLIEGGFRKAGSVAVVIKCPSSNREPYLVQFADSTQTQALFSELVLRRLEVDTLLELDDEDLNSFVVYECQVGSRAFGLSTETSDDDRRGIFMPDAERHWSLYRLPEQLEFLQGQDDLVYWELEKFVRLALKANPNILETLWTPHVTVQTTVSERLRSIRSAFLSRHVYKTYSGYVLSQFRRMKKAFEKAGKFKTKHAMHLLRLQHSGISALKTGEIMIDVSHHRDLLMKVRHGEFSFQEVSDMAMQNDVDFQRAFEKTDLPEQPDFATVNDFVIEARRMAIDFWTDNS